MPSPHKCQGANTPALRSSSTSQTSRRGGILQGRAVFCIAISLSHLRENICEGAAAINGEAQVSFRRRHLLCIHGRDLRGASIAECSCRAQTPVCVRKLSASCCQLCKRRYSGASGLVQLSHYHRKQICRNGKHAGATLFRHSPQRDLSAPHVASLRQAAVQHTRPAAALLWQAVATVQQQCSAAEALAVCSSGCSASRERWQAVGVFRDLRVYPTARSDQPAAAVGIHRRPGSGRGQLRFADDSEAFLS